MLPMYSCRELWLMTDQWLPPICPIKIANKLGIWTGKTSTMRNGVVAEIEAKIDEPAIIVKDDLPFQSKRFLVAHCLGHLLCYQMANGERREEKTDNFNLFLWDSNEKEATLFALDLLIPLRTLKEALEAGIRDIENLSTLFGLDKSIIEYALIKLRRCSY